MSIAIFYDNDGKVTRIDRSAHTPAALDNTAIATDENWVQVTTTIALATLGIVVGQPGLLEVTHNVAVAGNLAGDAAMLGLGIEWV